MGGDTTYFGGDVFASGEEINIQDAVTDVMACGATVRVTAPVSGDVHVCGYSVTVDSTVGKDLYSGGFEVTTSAKVAGNVSIMAFRAMVEPEAEIAGNLRIGGSEVVVRGNVAGYALLSGDSVRLDGAVDGDVRIETKALSFGPNARVNGALEYRTPEPMEVPVSVANASNVKYTALAPAKPEMFPGMGRGAGLRGGAIVLAGLLISGALLLALFPRFVEAGLEKATHHPVKAGLTGLAVCAAVLVSAGILFVIVIGAVPGVAMMSLLPMMMLLGCLIGSLSLAALVWHGIGQQIPDTWLARFGLMAAGVAVFGAIWLVPYVGVIVNLLVVLIGLGAAAMAAFQVRQSISWQPATKS
jgi:hypothetical protein